MSEQIKIDDWIDGERDCKSGLPADPSRNEQYQSGYSFRYQMDECVTMRNQESEHAVIR